MPGPLRILRYVASTQPVSVGFGVVVGGIDRWVDDGITVSLSLVDVDTITVGIADGLQAPRISKGVREIKIICFILVYVLDLDFAR